MPQGIEGVRSIPEYLELLRHQLAGSDPALVQDALYDAEEYLRSETAQDARPEALAKAVERFGSPAEVAESYRENEVRVAKALRPPPITIPEDGLQRLFGVFRDPHTYGALVYMLLGLPTGILYFVWAVTGLSLSLGLSILIIGLPFFLGYLASIRFFSLLEGRLVEALLGVRMPRRPPHQAVRGSIWARLTTWLSDRRTWTTLLYMVLKLPLGILSFTLFISLFAIALALLASPIAQSVFGMPFAQVRDQQYFLPVWSYPLCWAASGVDLLILMHLARLFGRAQGALAKGMLVSAEGPRQAGGHAAEPQLAHTTP